MSEQKVAKAHKGNAAGQKIQQPKEKTDSRSVKTKAYQVFCQENRHKEVSHINFLSNVNNISCYFFTHSHHLHLLLLLPPFDSQEFHKKGKKKVSKVLGKTWREMSEEDQEVYVKKVEDKENA